MDSLLSLLRSPLFALLATLVTYQGAAKLQKHYNNHPLLNPVLISAALLSLGLYLTGIRYEEYFQGARMIHFLLGPATVALAIPLYTQLHHIRRAFVPILAAITIGTLFAIASTLAIAWLCGASHTTLLSLAPKSVTTPIAMALSEKIGGNPNLTVLVVVLTGVFGAMAGRGVVQLFRIKDWRATGLGMGVASHGVGTARAVQINETAGAFASLAMGLTGLLTALVLPWLATLLP